VFSYKLPGYCFYGSSTLLALYDMNRKVVFCTVAVLGHCLGILFD